MKKTILVLVTVLSLAIFLAAQTHTFPALDTNNAFTGANTCKNQETVRCVDAANAAGWTGSDLGAWINAAIANLPSAGGTVFVASGSYTLGTAVTIGSSPCQNNYGQTVWLDSSVVVTQNAKITLLCGGYLHGSNRNGDQFTAGGSFPSSTPMVTMGDNVNVMSQVDIDNLTLHCNNVTSCTGISALGINEGSFIKNLVIEFYTANGININGTTLISQNYVVSENIISASASAANEGILVTNSGISKFLRNEIVSNSAGNQPNGAMRLTGANGYYDIIDGLHCEKYNSCLKLDNVLSATVTGLDATNGVVNGIELTSAFNGVLTAHQIRNAGGTVAILNSVPSINRSIASNTEPNSTLAAYEYSIGGAERVSGILGGCFNAVSNNGFCIGSAATGFFRMDSAGTSGFEFRPVSSTNAITGMSLSGLKAVGTGAGLTGTGTCATITTQVGGAWAGSAKCTGTAGAATLTITPGTTAPNGWICAVEDETTRADLFQQTSHTTTTCVLTATAVAQNDIFVFSAIAF